MKHKYLKVLLASFVIAFIVFRSPIAYADETETNNEENETTEETSPLAQAFELNASNVINYIATGLAYCGTAIGSVGVISTFFKKKRKETQELLEVAKSQYSEGIEKTKTLIDETKNCFTEELVKANELINTYKNDTQTLINELKTQILDISAYKEQIEYVTNNVKEIESEITLLLDMMKEYLLNDTASIKDGVARKVDAMVIEYDKLKASEDNQSQD